MPSLFQVIQSKSQCLNRECTNESKLLVNIKDISKIQLNKPYKNNGADATYRASSKTRLWLKLCLVRVHCRSMLSYLLIKHRALFHRVWVGAFHRSISNSRCFSRVKNIPWTDHPTNGPRSFERELLADLFHQLKYYLICWLPI